MMKILFICEHNSARSQMAEAYLNHFGGDRLFAESAGLEAGALNSHVVDAMAEEGINISYKRTKSAFDLYKSQKQFDAVITVCSPAVSEKCPIFPGRVKRWNWPFADPSKLVGSHEEILAQIREIRNQIKTKILAFIKEYDEKGVSVLID